MNYLSTGKVSPFFKNKTFFTTGISGQTFGILDLETSCFMNMQSPLDGLELSSPLSVTKTPTKYTYFP